MVLFLHPDRSRSRRAPTLLRSTLTLDDMVLFHNYIIMSKCQCLEPQCLFWHKGPKGQGTSLPPSHALRGGGKWHQCTVGGGGMSVGGWYISWRSGICLGGWLWSLLVWCWQGVASMGDKPKVSLLAKPLELQHFAPLAPFDLFLSEDYWLGRVSTDFVLITPFKSYTISKRVTHLTSGTLCSSRSSLWW